MHKSKTRLYPLLQGKDCLSSSYYREIFTLELQGFVVILTPKQRMSVSSWSFSIWTVGWWKPRKLQCSKSISYMDMDSSRELFKKRLPSWILDSRPSTTCQASKLSSSPTIEEKVELELVKYTHHDEPSESPLKCENATVSLQWFLFDAFILFHVVPDIFIGASLSEPHTSVTSLRARACVCLYACLRGPTTYRKF